MIFSLHFYFLRACTSQHVGFEELWSSIRLAFLWKFDEILANLKYRSGNFTWASSKTLDNVVKRRNSKLNSIKTASCRTNGVADSADRKRIFVRLLSTLLINVAFFGISLHSIIRYYIVSQQQRNLKLCHAELYRKPSRKIVAIFHDFKCVMTEQTCIRIQNVGRLINDPHLRKNFSA